MAYKTYESDINPREEASSREETALFPQLAVRRQGFYDFLRRWGGIWRHKCQFKQDIHFITPRQTAPSQCHAGIAAHSGTSLLKCLGHVLPTPREEENIHKFVVYDL